MELRIWKIAAMATLAALAAACSRPSWHEALEVEGTTVGNIPNASKFGDEVIFGAQPTEADIAVLAAAGVKTVLNLRTAEEMAELGYDEEAAAHKAGLRYLNIPVGREQPSEGTLGLINSIIDDPERHPLFIHCASSNRVGYVWAMYRGTRNGLPMDQALAEGRLAGMRSPILEQWAREHIGAAQGN